MKHLEILKSPNGPHFPLKAIIKVSQNGVFRKILYLTLKK